MAQRQGVMYPDLYINHCNLMWQGENYKNLPLIKFFLIYINIINAKLRKKNSQVIKVVLDVRF